MYLPTNVIVRRSEFVRFGVWLGYLAPEADAGVLNLRGSSLFFTVL